MTEEGFAEVVVECGCEGGSITVLRLRDGQGAWRYWVESDERLAIALLDDEDRQGLQPHAMSSTVSSLKKALFLLDRYPWHQLSHVALHPDCQQEVLKAVKKRGGEECAKRWEVRAALTIQRRQLPRT